MGDSSSRRWLNVRETAVYLHFHPQHVYELLSRGELPAARIGGAWRVDSKALDELLERQIKSRAAKRTR